MLGYHRQRGHWRHPEGRVAVFLGDYIDRGPAILEVLGIVRSMVDDGVARAIMGNHEFNALAYHTADPENPKVHLRPHTDRNTAQHGATLDQIRGRKREWNRWIKWFYSLPLWLDLEGVRAAHACWDSDAMRRIGAGIPIHHIKASNQYDPQALCNLICTD